MNHSHFTEIDIEKYGGLTGSPITEMTKINEHKIMLSFDSKLQNHIIKNIIQPSYIQDAEDLIKWRFRWRKYGDRLSAAADVCIIVSGILSFLSPALHNETLAICAGCIAFTAVQLQNWSKDSQRRSTQLTVEVNDLLKALNIAEIPDLIENANSQHPKNPELKIK